jgi:NADH dehydrogenase
MKNAKKRVKVVIVGGGFAGIEIARRLGKNRSVEVTMVSNNTCFQYYPNLYRLVVGASVNQVSIPLSKVLPKSVSLVVDAYTGMDVAQKTISLKSGATVAYDYIVMAMGSEANYFGIDGMETHAKNFLSIERALALKALLLQSIQEAKQLPEAEAKIKLHTIIVGAGPSGTELAGRLGGFLKEEAKKAGVNPSLIGIDLLDSAPRVLAALPEDASQRVTKQLQRQGVTVYTNYGVNACDQDCITVTNKNTPEPSIVRLESGTVIWTAGTKISSSFATIPGVVMTDKKRVQVSATLTLPASDSVYIAGDGAGTLYSGLAQTAIDQGQYLAKAIADRIAGKPVSDYVPQPGVFVIPVGKFWGILNKKQFTVSGPAAYIIRILVDARYFLSITTPWNVIKMLRKESAQ